MPLSMITIAPFGRVERQGVPPGLGKNQILHEGAIGTFGAPGDYSTEQLKYGAWVKKPVQTFETTGGWMGITDKYWMAALIPDQTERLDLQGHGQGEPRHPLARSVSSPRW